VYSETVNLRYQNVYSETVNLRYQNVYSETVNRRKKKTNKTLHRKQKIEQHG
jgi:hypothetical protein